MKLSPPQYVVKIFGGVRPAARAIGRDPSAIVHWVKVGRVPSSARLEILSAAKKLKLALTSEHLDYGWPIYIQRAGRAKRK